MWFSIELPNHIITQIPFWSRIYISGRCAFGEKGEKRTFEEIAF